MFITFEGGEGCGKSVQARALYNSLSRMAIPALLTHEPGGTPLGQKITYWVKWAQHIQLSPQTELLLFNASRSELVSKVIQPALKKGIVVICDRYADSTIAYQSYGRGIDLQTVKTINEAATCGLAPDLTLLLDISPEEGLARKQDRKNDRFEMENITFHRRVRQGYLKLAASEPNRWLVIDASQSKEKVRDIIWQRVSRVLGS